MSEPSDDEDTIERGSGPAGLVEGGSQAALPTEEQPPNPAEQKRLLLAQIEDVRGRLRYMGSGHPRRQAEETHLRQLESVLEEMERLLAANRVES